jgi:serine/threonine protein kinase/tetratricopeptide (TPR) repeat protein
MRDQSEASTVRPDLTGPASGQSQPPEDRVGELAEAFLQRHRRGERPSVEEYAAAHPELAGEIRRLFPAVLMMERLKPAASDPTGGLAAAGGTAPQRLGDYRILREVGRGGMGVVYEAEQESLGRRVALKVLPEALCGDARARERFLREARAAARMHHTNIVPVFDVGHDGGYIYYAMQLIHGQGLDLVIDEVRRLRQGGGGASPGVTAEGERSLAASLILGRYKPEDLAAAAMTPKDASPPGPVEETADHAAGAPSSAALPGSSDLSAAQGDRRAYYLGVARIGLQAAAALGYAHARGVVHRDIKPSNLLLDAAGVVWMTDFGLAQTGEAGMTRTGDIVGTIRYMAPERFRGQCDVRSDVYALGLTLYELLVLHPAFTAADRLELIERIRREEPAAPRAADRGLPRDLETIVVKAITKEPQQRYQSAEELEEDLRRFVAGEPVQARRIWAAERLARWVRRNPTVAGLAAAAFLAMALGMAVSTWQMMRARRAVAGEKEANAAERAAKVAAQDREAEMGAVLKFVEERVFAAARPEGQEGGLGHKVTLRQAIDAALPFVAEGFAARPLIAARLRRTLGTSYYHLGELRTAAEQYEASRALYARHRGPDDPETLTSMNSLANCYRALGRHAEALELLEETLALMKAKLGPDDPETLTSMNNLAIIYQVLGRHAEALKLLDEALAVQKAKLGPDHTETLRSMINLASSYFALGRPAEALRLQEETLALQKGRLGLDHPETLATMNNLANSYETLGRRAEALKLREATLALRRAKLGPDHDATLITMHNLALSYQALGRHAEALKLREEALALEKAKLGPDHPDTLSSKDYLADSYHDLGRHAEALKLREETLRLRRATQGSDHFDTLGSMSGLALSYQALGRHAEALKLHEETLALRRAKLGPDHPDTFGSRLKVASCLVQLGRGAEAVADSRRAAETWEKVGDSDADSLYTAAGFRAVAAAALPSADRSPAGANRAEAEADQAMAWLERAVAAGYRNAPHMAEDHDLDALRHRADFKELMARLSATQPK